jgi:hypothetical protein
MPSSWSASLRFELQFTGENINLWGDKLNAVLSHADYAVAGWLTKALTGDYTLTTANAGDDEARAAMLKFTGTSSPPRSWPRPARCLRSPETPGSTSTPTGSTPSGASPARRTCPTTTRRSWASKSPWPWPSEDTP